MAKEDFNPVSSSFETVQCFYLRYCVLRHFVKYGLQWFAASLTDVFRLHYPRVLHCRIVPIQKLKTLGALERKRPPITVVLSEFGRSNLKVTRKFAKTPRGLHAHHQNIKHIVTARIKEL
jgi:hypothetical protein